jgi:hypothetical protein
MFKLFKKAEYYKMKTNLSVLDPPSINKNPTSGFVTLSGIVTAR